VIAGSAEVGAIVCTPEPGMLKSIRLGPGLTVGIDDRLAEGTGSAVAGAGHGERRQQATIFEQLHRRETDVPPGTGSD